MESFDGLELYKHDLQAVTSQIKKQESLLRLKRRWLMNLPLSVNEQHAVEEMLPGNDKMLPESFIWNDDLCYEDVRTCIEKAFRVYHNENQHDILEEDLQTLILGKGYRNIFSLLDNMNSESLCSFLELLTGAPSNIKGLTGKTRKTVKEFLSKLIADDSDVSREKVKKLLQILKDENNLEDIQVSNLATSVEYHVATQTVIKVLKKLNLRALRAMKRKLQGVKGYIPSLNPQTSGMARSMLVRQVKNLLVKMQSDIDKVSENKERLADAFGVASLALKLMNHPGLHEFRKISPETEAFQTEILKVIALLNERNRISLGELHHVQLLLDAKPVPIRRLRSAVRNLLTEYLFECNFLYEIPSYVKDIVEIINRCQIPVRRKKSVLQPGHSCPDAIRDVMQKEIECVLTVSAQANQVILDLLPDLEVDAQFALAYMDESEESDGLYTSDDEINGSLWPCESHPADSFGQPESIGDMNPSILSSRSSWRVGVGNNPLPSRSERSLNMPLELPSVYELSSVEVRGSGLCKAPRVANGAHPTEGIRLSASEFPKLSNLETTSLPTTKGQGDPMEQIDFTHEKESTSNRYLEFQHACNSTSMVAYNFVGLVLDRLAYSHGIEISQKNRLYLGASVSPNNEGFQNPPSESALQEIWRSLARQ